MLHENVLIFFPGLLKKEERKKKESGTLSALPLRKQSSPTLTTLLTASWCTVVNLFTSRSVLSEMALLGTLLCVKLKGRDKGGERKKGGFRAVESITKVLSIIDEISVVLLHSCLCHTLMGKN